METKIEYIRYVRKNEDVRRKGQDETAGTVIKGNFPDAGAAGYAFQIDGEPVPG